MRHHQIYAAAAIQLYIRSIECLVSFNYVCNRIPLFQYNHFSHNYISCIKKKTLLSKTTAVFNEGTKLEHEKNYRNLLTSNTSDFLEFIDANKLGYIVEDEIFTIASVQKRLYLPEELARLNKSMNSWTWWENRRKAESALKRAIASDKYKIDEYFDEYKRYLTSDYTDILQTNHDFYQALSEGDINLMSSIWYKSDDSLCIMNGQENVVTGYENIVALWSMHMPTSQSFDLQNVKLFYQGDLAFVTFILNSSLKSSSKIMSSSKSKLASVSSTISSAYITNVFVKPSDSDRYQLFAHIGSNFLPTDNKYMANLREFYQDPSSEKKQQPLRGRSDGFGGFVQFVNSQSEEGDEEEEEENDEEVEYIVEDSVDLEGLNEDEKEVEFGKIMKERMRRIMGKAIGQALTKSMGLNGNKDGNFIVIDGSELDGSEAGGGRIISSSSLANARKAAYPGDKIRSGKLRLNKNADDEGNDDDDDEDDNEDDGSVLRSRVWLRMTSRTISCVKWLSEIELISEEEKSSITSKIIEKTANGEESKAVIAYALLIEGFNKTQINGGDDEDGGDEKFSSVNMLDVDKDDMEDFEQFCHRYALLGEDLLET